MEDNKIKYIIDTDSIFPEIKKYKDEIEF